jgi:hypothetical protein
MEMTAENFHQGRFAGAVFADDCVRLAGADTE